MLESGPKNEETISGSEKLVLRYKEALLNINITGEEQQKLRDELSKMLDHSKSVVRTLQGKVSTVHREQILRQELRLITLITEILSSI